MRELIHWKKALVAVVLATAAAAAFAVGVNGRIKGTIADQSGASIPNAAVTATNQATGVVFRTTSQADGSYTFLSLPPGAYTIGATASGFKAFSATGITIAIDQEYVEPVRLTVGSAVETVEVQADAVQVNTTDMQLNNIVTAKEITELPLIGRSFTALETILPGVQSSNDRFGSYSANGAQTQQSSYLINGADTNDLALNTVAFSPNIDAIEEFNLVTGPLNAEYDRNSGGVVSATIKQGTNHVHGAAFEFYRDTFLNAPNFFAYSSTTDKKTITPYHQNIFGGTIGGPILRDKAFFFFAYEGTRQRIPGDGGNTTVFSAAELGGNFSDNLAANGGNLGYSFSGNPIPATLSIPGCTAPGETFTQCAAANGGVFPTSAFNPISVALLKFVPSANSGANGYIFPSTSANSANQYIPRIDFSPNARNQFYGLALISKSTTSNNIPFTGASLPGFGENNILAFHQYTFDYVHQFNATLVNDFAAHYSRFNYQAVIPQTVVQPSTLGFAITPQNGAAASVPYIDTGYFQLGFSTNGPQPRIDQVYQLDDNISKTFGHHNLKFGYDGRKYNVSNPFNFSNNGAFGFAPTSNNSSGDPGLDFLLGNPSSYAQNSGAKIQAQAFLNYVYAQDTWRATQSLTISYGLGYQIDTPLHNLQYGGEAASCFIPGEQSTIFPTAPVGLVYPGDKGCKDSSQARTRYGDFGPRIGFAFTPNLGFISAGDSKKLSIRAGYGIYYNRTEEETSLNNLATPPFGLASNGVVDYGGVAPTFANPYEDITTGQVFPNKFPYTFPIKGQAIDYSVFEPMFLNTYSSNFRSPYSENFQLSIERELPSQIVARFSYVGEVGRHNQTTIEGNPITQAGHDACLASPSCASKKTTFYRNLQTYFYPSHTQFGYVDPVTGSPAFGAVGVVESEGSSNYNSLQASVQKGFSHGLTFQLSYTFSHALDTASSYESSGYGGSSRGYNQFDKGLNYGNAAFDARHRLVFAPIYTVPFKTSGSTYSVSNILLSGWQISAIATLATGFPFDISYGGGSSNSLYCAAVFSFYACPDEPNQVGPLIRNNPRTRYSKNLARTTWFTPDFLAAAPLGKFGNMARNRYHGPGSNNTNLILAKNFALSREGVTRLQIRMESDNVFNHTQFNNPISRVGVFANGSLNTASAGQLTSAQPGRLSQLAAKLYF